MKQRERIDFTYREFECRCGHRIVICLEVEKKPRWATCACGRILRLEPLEKDEK